MVVGPEDPLVNGIVDYLENFNIKVNKSPHPAGKAENVEASKFPPRALGLFSCVSSQLKSKKSDASPIG